MTPTRYWLEFDRDDPRVAAIGARLGCGVTARNYGDALRLAESALFAGGGPPIVRRVVEDFDISTLDPDHVRPNMLPPIVRGVWFPIGPYR